MTAVSTMRRAWRFYAVGALGIAVQLAALWLLTHAGFHYMAATVLAVEAAVLHNFVWHQHYTWAERLDKGARAYLWRLVKFNSTTGLVSIGGNVVLMRLLVGEAGLRPLLANVLSIASCSLVNFLVSDRAVFQPLDTPLEGYLHFQPNEVAHEEAAGAPGRTADFRYGLGSGQH